MVKLRSRKLVVAEALMTTRKPTWPMAKIKTKPKKIINPRKPVKQDRTTLAKKASQTALRHSPRVKKPDLPTSTASMQNGFSKTTPKPSPSTARKLQKRRKSSTSSTDDENDDMKTKTATTKKQTKKPKVSNGKKHPNDKLVPRPDLPDILEEPTFSISTPPKYVSAKTAGRLALRAIINNDVAEFRRIVNDKDRFPSSQFDACRSHADNRDLEGFAILSQDRKMIDAYLAEKEKRGKESDDKRVLEEPNLMQEQGTGRANIRMLGHATRAIQMTRGAREGNNALVNYEHSSADDIMVLAASNDTDFAIFEHLVSTEKSSLNRHAMATSVYHAVRCGHRKLAAKLAQNYSSYNFNELHMQTLNNETQPLKKFVAVSVLKKGRDNRNITPVHTACINPNASYLKQLIATEPGYNAPDLDNWYPIHYAAVCDGVGPLKLLLDRGALLTVTNKRKETPLHCAARAGRVANVALLLKALKMEAQKTLVNGKDDEEKNEEEEDEIPKKSPRSNGKAATLPVNQCNHQGYTPLHLAVKHDRREVVNLLLRDSDVEVDAQANATHQKVTPLMMACQHGLRNIAEDLVKNGNAIIEKRDKLKRTALIHAVINGNSHCAAYLLRLGADPSLADSSGNTPLHYAVAYGWFYCVELLLRAAPEALQVNNDWHLSPFAIAYLKGHSGIVDQLLEGPHANLVDVNCTDNEGVNLISSLIKFYTTIDSAIILHQLQYLISKKLNCSITDTAGNSPLHYFAAVGIQLQTKKNTSKKNGNASKGITPDEYKKCVDLIIKTGADPRKRNEEGKTALAIALARGNLLLTEYLFDRHSETHDLLEMTDSTTKQNILHQLIRIPFSVYQNSEDWAADFGPLETQYDVVPLLEKICKSDADMAKQWLNEYDKCGMTPTLFACSEYCKLRLKNLSVSDHTAALKREAEKVLNTVGIIIKLFTSIEPRCILQCTMLPTVDEKKEASSNDTNSFQNQNRWHKTKKRKGDHYNDQPEPVNDKEGVSCLQYAIQGNSCVTSRAKSWTMNEIEHITSKKLLVNLIGLARNDGLFEELLTLKNAKHETGLLFALKHNLAIEALLLVHESLEAGFGSLVHSAVIPTVLDEHMKDKPCLKSAVMLAIEHGIFGVVQALALSKQQWNHADAEGNNALHYAAALSKPNTVDYFEFLKRKGVAFTTNSYGRTPLHVAVNATASAGADVLTQPVEWLCSHYGAESLFKQDEDGHLPLHYAFIKYNQHHNDSEHSTKPIEPIAVISVLLHAMQNNKPKLNTTDKYGNTALHLAAKHGANICVITLLRHGCDPHLINKAGNTPLALAALHKHEPSTLTLIQANSDIQRDCFIELPANKEKPDVEKQKKWIWNPRLDENRSPSPQSIISIIVRNEWQGIIFIILDLLSKTVDTVCKLLTAALEHRKYNLASALLRTLTEIVHTVDSRNLEHYHIFEAFCRHSDGDLNEHVKKLVNELFQMGIPWTQKHFSSNATTSQSLIEAAKRGCFELMDYIIECDTKHNDGQNWHRLTANAEENPISAIVNYTVENNAGKQAMVQKWLITLSKKLDINQSLLFDRPYYAGIVNGLPQRPVAMQYHAPPLIHAIQHRNIDLVRALVNLPSIDVNLVDEDGLTPLMHAVQTNSELTVKLLLDPRFKDDSDATVEAESPTTSAPMNAMFGATFVNARKNTMPKSTKKGSGAKKNSSFQFSNTKLDYLQTDRQGANFVHYMISPCGWENTGLLKQMSGVLPNFNRLLAQRGGPQIATPGQLAALLGQTEMAIAIANYTKTTTPPQFTIPGKVPDAKFDFNQDSKRFMDQWSAEKPQKSPSMPKPHKNSGYATTGELVLCNTTGQLMNVLMNKTDVQFGTCGFHNYYRMQLIRRKGSELYVLFTNWGRIGDATGQFQRTPFSSLAEGSKEFMSIYKSKSGNEWGPFAGFVEKPGKYRLINLETESPANITELSINFDKYDTNETEAEKQDDIYQLIKNVSNVRRLQQRTRMVCQYSQLTQPFGRLNREDIVKAKAVLELLRLAIAKIEEARRTASTGSGNVEQILTLLRQQATLSNDFYRYLPLGGFEDQILPVIDRSEIIDEFDGVIENLLEFEIAGRILTAAALRQIDMNPYRYIQSVLACDIQLADPTALTTQYILQYINSSCSSVRVTAIFEVNAGHVNQVFGKDRLKNQMYLWHGTKPENMLSILKLGLLVTPPSAIQTGQLHGKGIYFADSFAKSQGYCTASVSGESYMFLCQVALGEQMRGVDRDDAEPKNPKSADSVDSLMIIGKQRPDPAYDITLTSGAVMPIGPLVETQHADFNLEPDTNIWMPHNEYIVFKPTQAAIRYIIAFK